MGKLLRSLRNVFSGSKTPLETPPSTPPSKPSTPNASIRDLPASKRVPEMPTSTPKTPSKEADKQQAPPSPLEEKTRESFEQSVTSSQQPSKPPETDAQAPTPPREKPDDPESLASATRIDSHQATMRAVKELLSLHKPPRMPSETNVSPRATKEADNAFILHGGATLQTIYDLLEAAKYMSSETFSHHVNAQRNDFSTWISESLGFKRLAADVQDVQSAKELEELLETFCLSKVQAGSTQESLDNELASLKEELANSALEYRHQEQEIYSLKNQLTTLSSLVKKQERTLKQQIKRLEDDKQELEQEVKEANKRFKEHVSAQEEASTKQIPVHAPRTLKQATTSAKEHSVQDLLKLIDEVRALIEASRWQEARQKYAAVREKFYEAESLLEEDRKSVYNLIRGLYADIKLQSTA